mgnify:CR=1 FL=1
MPAFTDAQVRNWIDEGGDDLYLLYRTVSEEASLDLSPLETRELFREVLEYCLQKGYLLLKVHPEAVKWRYSRYPEGRNRTPHVPVTPRELVEYYRLFWPPFRAEEYDTEVLITLEVGCRVWWPDPGNEPTEWFNNYPENAPFPHPKYNPCQDRKERPAD